VPAAAEYLLLDEKRPSAEREGPEIGENVATTKDDIPDDYVETIMRITKVIATWHAQQNKAYALSMLDDPTTIYAGLLGESIDFVGANEVTRSLLRAIVAAEPNTTIMQAQVAIAASYSDHKS
jgi:hypothetical protein